MKKKLVSIVLTAMVTAAAMTACGSKDAASGASSATKTETAAPDTTAKTDTKAETKTDTKTETKTDTKTENAPAESSTDPSYGFTLLDVSADMIETGVYAENEDGTELVLSMFKDPSGTPMASLFVFPTAGEGDVICGTYTIESETDEDGIAWSVLTVTDAYTDDVFTIGSGESGDEVYLFDIEGTPYEGKYLTADETIVFMGTAAALMEDSASASSSTESAPASSEGFTLMDISADMIQSGIYAQSEDGTELVLSMFTEPSGTPMASLFVFPDDGSGDIICGAYTAESETDEDGITWSVLTVTDVYTGDVFTIGAGEADGDVYLFDVEGTPYEGTYLTADETIVFMGTAAALMQ